MSGIPQGVASGAQATPMESLRKHFSTFLGAAHGRLHFAAHSHHLWPDVTQAAQQEAWQSAARHWDDKWDTVFGELIPDCQRHIASILGLSEPTDIAFAPNTHELVLRLVSTLEATPQNPVRILTTDGEFHSFRRQCLRLREAGCAELDIVPLEPFDTFEPRFRARAASGDHGLIYVSQVFFNSGYVHGSLAETVHAVPSDETLVVIDGYHGFMALPTDLGALESRAFYLAGGYKYAMAGEGACFAHCPPGYAERPVNTGWYAGFDDLAQGPGAERVTYRRDASRLFGSTFDPSGLYRLRAVLRWLEELKIGPAQIHSRVRQLQDQFLDRLDQLRPARVRHRAADPRPRRAGASQLPDLPHSPRRGAPGAPCACGRGHRSPRRPATLRLRALPRAGRRGGPVPTPGPTVRRGLKRRHSARSSSSRRWAPYTWSSTSSIPAACTAMDRA